MGNAGERASGEQEEMPTYNIESLYWIKVLPLYSKNRDAQAEIQHSLACQAGHNQHKQGQSNRGVLQLAWMSAEKAGTSSPRVRVRLLGWHRTKGPKSNRAIVCAATYAEEYVGKARERLAARARVFLVGTGRRDLVVLP